MNASQMIQSVVEGQDVDGVIDLTERVISLDDKQIKRIARNFTNEFKSWLKSRLDDLAPRGVEDRAHEWGQSPDEIHLRLLTWTVNQNAHIAFSTYKGDNPVGEARKIEVEFIMINDSSNLSANIAGIFSNATYVPGDSVIRVYVNGYTPLDRIQKALTSKLFEKTLASLLSHELTHAMEPVQKYAGYRNVTSDRDYHNIPDEVRANMQQIAREVTDYLKTKRNAKKDLNWNIRMALLRGSQSWKRVSKNLTTANRKRTLKAMYQFVSDQGLV